MAYYDVHCVKCGEKFESGYMAFDFDRILKESLESNRNYLLEDSDTEPFKEIKLGLYFSFFDLQSRFGVTEGESKLVLMPQDIVEFIEERYGVILREFTSVDGLFADGFATLAFYRFCDQLTYFDAQKDTDQETKRNNIQAVCRYLLDSENQNPLLECTVQVQLSTNDQGDSYASGLLVRYSDGKSTRYFEHMFCPECGNPLYFEAGKHKEYLIGMIGSARVGKTAYLASLINAMKPEYGASDTPSVVITSDNSERWTNFSKNVLMHYQNSEKIPKTEVIDEMVSLFTIDVGVEEKEYLFTFIDMPGEAFTGEFQFVVEKRPILQHTDLFWFCIDPVQIDATLLHENGSETGADVVETDMFKVIGNIRPVLKYINSRKKVKAAIVLTKSDLVDPRFHLFEPNVSQIMPLVEGNKFRWERFVNTAANVRDYFNSPNVRALKDDFKQMFSVYNYFAIASYGKKITSEALAEGETSRGNLPSHVKDPFVWTLACLGLLEVVTYETRIQKCGLFGKKDVADLWPVEESYLYCQE